MNKKHLEKEYIGLFQFIEKQFQYDKAWCYLSYYNRAEDYLVMNATGLDDSKKKIGLIIVNGKGEILEGSDANYQEIKTHLLLYKKLHQIDAISHIHTLYATVWAQANRSIPFYGSSYVGSFANDFIPVANKFEKHKEGKDQADLLSHAILDLFSDQEILINNLSFPSNASESTLVKTKSSLAKENLKAVLVKGYGPFTFGKNLSEAVTATKNLEELARLSYLTERLNHKVEPFSYDLRESLAQKHCK